MKALLAQLRIELLLTVRRGESLLVTLAIPVGLLAFFSTIEVVELPSPRAGALAPGVAAIAIMATAMVSLGIATGFERHYLVLKRIGGTPLGRGRLIAAKILSVLAIEVVQVCVIAGVAYLLGARPDLRVGPLMAAVLLGTFAFAGVGLVLAGNTKAELNLAASNGIFVLLLLLGGAVIPLGSLPDQVAAVSRALPLNALTEGFASAMGATARPGWAVLAVWAFAAPLLAALTFRWEPGD